MECQKKHFLAVPIQTYPGQAASYAYTFRALHPKPIDQGNNMRKKTIALLLVAAATLTNPFGASAQTNKLISWTNVWAYNDTTDSANNLHGTGWELPGYNTNSAPGWKTGRALFGNDSPGVYDSPGSPFTGGINGFATPLDRNPTSRVTYYFRAKFNWPGSPAGVILVSSNVVDDGMVVYLNGTEVIRKFLAVLAPDPVTWDTLGQNHDPEGTIFVDQPSPATLVTGENTVAVEVHQSSLASSDVAFALTLEGYYQFRPFFTDATQPTNRVVLQNRSTTLSVFASASPPVSYQWFFQPTSGGGFNPITDATNTSYTIPLMAAGNAGSYFATVSNPAGSTNSRTATVGYTADTAPPTLVRATANATFTEVRVEFSEMLDPVTSQDASKYSISGGIGVVASLLSFSGKSVLLSLNATMAPNTIYTITVNGVGDLALNFMTSANITVRSWVPSPVSGLVFEAFNGTAGPEIAGLIPGNAVSILTSHPSYPSNASEVLLMPGLSTRLVTGYDGNSHEAYGARIRGLFFPPESGNWVFYISSDDSSQLFMNTNGPSAAGKTLIAQQPGCCNNFTYSPGNLSSFPIPLVGGQAYYIEGIFKEGVGGDYMVVAPTLEGEPVPSGGDGGSSCAICSDPSMVGAGAMPVGAVGTNSITQHPVSITVPANATATFRVGVNQQYGLPVLYQWRRDGAAIPFANNSSYSFVAALSDNGAVFSCAVTNLDGAGLISSNATLTVVLDTASPTVVSSTPSSDGSGIVVVFNERMGSSAGNRTNYTINGVLSASATLSADLMSATVAFTTPLALCGTNVLRINSVTDLAGNVLSPNPTTIAFNTPLLLVPINATKLWRWESSGADLTAAGWQNPSYNDSAWQSGPGVLAWEPNDNTPLEFPIRTLITDYTNGAYKATIYFRTHFNLPTDPKAITQLQLSEIIDDGSVVYLNGTEVHRLRVNAGALTYSTQASAGAAEPHLLEGPFNIPTSALVYGDNVLAIAVLQSGTASSDIVMGAQLLAIAPGCVSPLYITRSGSNVTLTWPDPTFSLQSAPTVVGPWLPQAGTSGFTTNGATGMRFYRLVK